MKDKIILLGNLYENDNNSLNSRVYGVGGVMSCIGASNFGKEKYIVVAERGRSYRGQETQLEPRKDGVTNTNNSSKGQLYFMQKEIIKLCSIYGQASRWCVYGRQGIAPTLTASMGMGGGHVPMVIINDKDKSSK